MEALLKAVYAQSDINDTPDIDNTSGIDDADAEDVIFNHVRPANPNKMNTPEYKAQEWIQHLDLSQLPPDLESRKNLAELLNNKLSDLRQQLSEELDRCEDAKCKYDPGKGHDKCEHTDNLQGVFTEILKTQMLRRVLLGIKPART